VPCFFDAQDKAFRSMAGLPARHLRQHEDGGGGDLAGRRARYNLRFLQMWLAPIDQTGASPPRRDGRGKVEKPGRNCATKCCRPKPRWLKSRHRAQGRGGRSASPTPSEQASWFHGADHWDVFKKKRESLSALRGPFDGFVERQAGASTLPDHGPTYRTA